ncbi:recombinase family protein [Escherichia coli]|nr:recombinase family protein [Escherichia coli]EIP4438899.1 recombinase family protein [Escherichia coli]HAW6878268.1 recombinase family protein [Escherichia coli]HEI0284080.1 recombinase family protein [Escherichia coli]
MKKAIAYMRFSSPGQMSGDSLNRQRRLITEWLKVNSDYYLDTVTYEDLGLSAFNGKHAQSGAFSEFLDAIEHGYILPGTTLLVESLDRLSREKVGEAIERLKLILNHGIDVITLCDNTVYNIDSLNEPYSLIKAILIAQRANEESEIKSSRVKLSWKKKRQDALESGTIMTASCPRWLSLDDKRTAFVPDPDRVKTIELIFKLRMERRSLNAIAKYLNDHAVKNFSGKESAWGPSVIEKLLANKALIGICVPSYRARGKGISEIAGYYPRVISDDLFYAVQEIRLAPFGISNSSKNPMLINLLRTVMKCEACGNTMIVHAVSGSLHGYYVCPMRRLHRCDRPSIKRDLVDYNIINELLFNCSKIQPVENKKDANETLELKIIELQMKINNLIAALSVAPEVTAIAEKIRVLDKELRRASVSLKTLKSKAVSSLGDFHAIDLTSKNGRELCRTLAYKTFEKIIINTDNKTCDIYFMNGIVFKHDPLMKTISAQQAISTLKYMVDGEVYF